MGYKIFYSYQSDVDSNLNKKFIRTAIDNAITAITEYQIEPLIEGFYGSGGNPPLLEKMLEQSMNADIFIGDVTFTMSKVWHTPLGFHEDANSYVIEIPKGDLKPAPNPNVLLETGYSWALKKFERTILVMNNAFGNPANLPVDMKGLRYPITYNLDAARADVSAKYKKELAALTESIRLAILDAIKSDINYQLKILSPFENHNRWARRHTYPLFLTGKFKTKLIELRKNISSYRNAQRIIGLEGTGKSRLVFEIFQENEDLPYDEANEAILYYDLLGSSFNDISQAINFIITQNQPKIVIVDNSSFEVHKKLTAQFKGTLIKLITINSVTSNKDTDGATIFIEEEISKEVNQRIIEERFKSSGKEIEFDLTAFKLEKTITILENNLENEIDGKTSLGLLKIIINEDEAPEGTYEFLRAVNLFGVVGFFNSYSKEMENVNNYFLKSLPPDNIDEITQSLFSKKLLSKKGDYLVTSGFEYELMEDWWADSKTQLNQVLGKLEGTGLLNKFTNRLLGLLNEEGQGELRKLLFAADSILLDKDFSDSYEGSELINKLTDRFPFEVLDLMDKKISNE